MKMQMRVLVPGAVAAEIITLSAPLSLWGGFDPANGLVIDRNHPDCGRSLAGKIVAMPYARGSSSSSSALLEAVRLGTSPSAFILSRSDPILAIGALVAADLYARHVPILVAHTGWAEIARAGFAAVAAEDGTHHCWADLQQGSENSD